MVQQHVSVEQAYAILELDRDAGAEELKLAYKKAALKTHPDKNHNDPHATAKFQEVGAAYNTLLRHFESPSSDEYDSGEDFDDENSEDLDFFRWLFEAMLAQKHEAYHERMYERAHRPRPRQRDETDEEFHDRLRREREQRKLAAERDKREREARKVRIQEQQERDKRMAESKRREQAAQKKNKKNEAKREKEKAVREQKERAQQLRSAVFKAAREGKVEKVKQGVWEDNIDAAGGEVKAGNEELSPHSGLIEDPKETLLHIAARQGNKELIDWLIRHNAEPEEKNSEGLTAFHVALKKGCTSVVDYFITSLSPSQEEFSPIYTHPPSINNLRLALQTAEPELVWMILEHKLAKASHISDAWSWFCSVEGEDVLKRKLYDRGLDDEEVEGKMEEIRNLLMTYGKFTPPSTPKIELEELSLRGNAMHHDRKPDASSPVPVVPSYSSPSPILQNPTPSPSPISSDQAYSYHSHSHSGSTSPSPSQSSLNDNAQRGFFRGRGRGRGKARGRGRGRGGSAWQMPSPAH